MSRYSRVCYEDVADCFNSVTRTGEWLDSVRPSEDAELCCRVLIQKLIDSLAVMFMEDSHKFSRKRFNRLFKDPNKEMYFDE